MVEIWKDIAGYENLYQVSNLGRVRSLDRILNHWRGGKRLRKGCVIKTADFKNGYKYVTLCKDGKLKKYLVHRLVAFMFLQNPNNYPCVNHKDENPSNNNVDNLEWCTQRYNINYGTRNEKISKKLLNYQSWAKPVLQYTKQGDLINEYPSIMEAERQTKIHSGSISNCCNNKRKTSGGFIWRYKNEE